jgi:starch-binding outer membrane protein, SusD/RagB family
MKSRRIIQVLFFFVLSLYSCKKYLDKNPDLTKIVPKTVEDLQFILDDAASMNLARTPSFGEASADDYFLLQATFDGRTDLLKDIYRWIPYDYYYSNDWSDSYYSVYNANICLEIIKTIPRTIENETRWNNVMGSALFFRAYYFSQLAWTYAKAYDEATANTDLGIVLRTVSDFNVPSVRATVSDTYQRILEDTKESIKYLPDNPQHIFRPSKAASYGLLARVYLSMRIYDSAFKYSNLCLGIKDNLIDYNSLTNNSSPFNTYQYSLIGETIFYTEMSNSFAGGLLSASRAKIDTSLYIQYANGDLRKTLFFQDNSGFQQFKGSYASPTFRFTGIATDEIYLTRAECFARGNNKDNALSDLNSLLKKRYNPNVFVPVTSTDANEALNKILVERRKELLMRGLRWVDIKRLNKEGRTIILKRIVSNQTYSLPPNSNYYALPLPKDIVDITGMQQN